jgi:hypothetical protein
MKDENLFTLLGLIGLTLVTVLVVIFWEDSGHLSVTVMAIAGARFYWVAFEFMEL